MSTGPEPKRRQRLDPAMRREAILVEAQKLLAHESPQQLTIELIAKRIGASPGLVHHYFGTKEGLVEAALSAAADDVTALLSVDAASDASPAEQLVVGLARYLDYIEAHPASWSTLLRTTERGAAAIAERVDHHAVEFSLGILMPGQAVPAALRAALRGWIALVKDVCWRWLSDELTREQVEQLLAVSYEGCLRAAVAADPAAKGAFDAYRRR